MKPINISIPSTDLEELIKTKQPLLIQVTLDPSDIGTHSPHIRTYSTNICTSVVCSSDADISGEMCENPKPKPQPRKKKDFNPDSVEYQLSALLLDLILERRPEYFGTGVNTPEKRDKKIRTWAMSMDKIIRIDNRDPELVEEVIK